jgi:hypothetical protein
VVRVAAYQLKMYPVGSGENGSIEKVQMKETNA